MEIVVNLLGHLTSRWRCFHTHTVFTHVCVWARVNHSGGSWLSAKSTKTQPDLSLCVACEMHRTSSQHSCCSDITGMSVLHCAVQRHRGEDRRRPSCRWRRLNILSLSFVVTRMDGMRSSSWLDVQIEARTEWEGLDTSRKGQKVEECCWGGSSLEEEQRENVPYALVWERRRQRIGLDGGRWLAEGKEEFFELLGNYLKFYKIIE